MQKFKGTPGKWFVDNDGDVSSDERGEIVAGVAGYEPSSEDRENAKLIAAAPELLEALQWAMARIGSYTQRTRSNQDYCDQVDKANAAIAKALGQ